MKTTRATAILICLVAALFLIPAQEECPGVSEYEPETEVVCSAVSSGMTLCEVAESVPEGKVRTARQLMSGCVAPYVCVSLREIPVRILNCVFRE